MIKSVFYGAMLDILILEKNIQEELIKKLLTILIMMVLRFLCKKNIFKKLKCKIIFALMSLVMKINLSFQFIFLIKYLKVQ